MEGNPVIREYGIRRIGLQPVFEHHHLNTGLLQHLHQDIEFLLGPPVDLGIAQAQVFLEKIVYCGLLVHPELHRADHQYGICYLHEGTWISRSKVLELPVYFPIVR